MIGCYEESTELRKRWIKKDGDLGRKHIVLNEKVIEE